MVGLGGQADGVCGRDLQMKLVVELVNQDLVGCDH